MATAINELLNCPIGCDTEVLLPAIPLLQDCTTYEQTNAQVSDLFIIPSAASDIFATWATTPTYVAASIDNAGATNAKAKWIVGIGGIAAPAKESIDYPKGKTKNTGRVYTLTFRVLNLSEGMYDFLRKLQCGSTAFKFYYGDVADFVYGKAGGLQPSSIDVDFPKGEGNNDKNQAILTLTWKADGDPERRINPYT